MKRFRRPAETQQSILALLDAERRNIAAEDLVKALGMKRNTAAQVLARMALSGRLRRVSQGVYARINGASETVDKEGSERTQTDAAGPAEISLRATTDTRRIR